MLVMSVQKLLLAVVLLIEDGDEIQVDAEKGTINLNVDNEILEKKNLLLISLMNLGLRLYMKFSQTIGSADMVLLLIQEQRKKKNIFRHLISTKMEYGQMVFYPLKLIHTLVL